MIEITNLTKTFGKRKAVDDISFRVEKGEVVGFLGPNGAGKTTTMSMITGFLSYTEGSIKVDGLEVVEHPDEVKKKIGYLPEQPPLYMDMTVKEYLNFMYELKKVKLPRQKHIEELYYYWNYYYNIRSLTLFDFQHDRTLDAEFEEIVRKCVEELLLEFMISKTGEKVVKDKWLTPAMIAKYYAQSMTFVVMNWIQSGMLLSPKEIAEIYDYIMTRSMQDIIDELKE